MAKVVSDSLYVKLSHKGREELVDLKSIFNDNPNGIVSVVGTVNEDGTPNTAPMSLFYCPSEKTIVAGMVKTSRTVSNIRRSGKLIIEVLFDGDIAYGITGDGIVVKDPLDSSEATLAVRIDVTSVKRDTSPAQEVTSGTKIKPRSERAVAYEKAVMDELASLGSQL